MILSGPQAIDRAGNLLPLNDERTMTFILTSVLNNTHSPCRHLSSVCGGDGDMRFLALDDRRSHDLMPSQHARACFALIRST
jgi:hypothetical protein